MTGIVGLLDSRSGVPQGLLADMSRRMAGRGPGFSEVLIRGNVGLGQQGPWPGPGEPAPQPLALDPASAWIVFDGSLQDRAALIAALRGRGRDPSDLGDAGLVLHAWLEWGDCCVDHFRGGFAFVVLDLLAGCLFLARDPLGLKPLAYCRTCTAFAFASEMEPLLLTPGFDGALDLTAIDQSLWLGYVPSPRSLYRQMASLPPAHRMRVDLEGRPELPRRYWSLRFDPERGLDRAEWEVRTAGAVRAAIVRHCVTGQVPGLQDRGDWTSSLILAGLQAEGITPGDGTRLLTGAGGAEAFGSATTYGTWLQEPSCRVQDWLRIIQVTPAPARAALWRPEHREAMQQGTGLFEDLWSQTQLMTDLQRVQFMDLSSRVPDGELRCADARTGLEPEAPLLDQDLVEMLARVPARMMARAPDGAWDPLAWPRAVTRHMLPTSAAAEWPPAAGLVQATSLPGPELLDRLRNSPILADLFRPAAMDHLLGSEAPATLRLLLALEARLDRGAGLPILSQSLGLATPAGNPGDEVHRIQIDAGRHDLAGVRAGLRHLLTLWPASPAAAAASLWLAQHLPPDAGSPSARNGIPVHALASFRHASTESMDHPGLRHAGCPDLLEPMARASRLGHWEVIVCGSGSVARRAPGLAQVLGMEIRCFTDRNLALQGKTLQGTPILSLDQGLALGLPCVVGTVAHAKEVTWDIRTRAKALGLDPPVIFGPHQIE